MKTAAIVGVGLIGGSFGLALRKAGFEGEILGVSSRPAIEAGLRAGAISQGAELAEAAERADLIYLAQPVDRILDTLELLGPMSRSGCLVTDAGSTKRAIVEKARGSMPAQSFLGGHPMAGKEARGVEAADADLFSGRVYVLTPTGEEDPQASAEFRGWLSKIGAEVLEISAAEHDAAVALTSHLPQLISTALAATLAEAQNANTSRIFGSGLLAMTRLALSPADLWASILLTNRREVLDALDQFAGQLGELRAAVATNEIEGRFKIASGFARSVRKVPITTDF